MVNAFGPRGTVLLSHVMCLIGWILTISSLTSFNLLAGRVLTGIFVGIVSVTATAYSDECFPTRPTARPVVYTAFGVFCVYLVGSLLNYAQTAGIVAVAHAVSFVLIRMFVPESPAWLESRGRVGDAEYSRLKLRLVVPAPAKDDEGREEHHPVGPVDFCRRFNRREIHRPFLAMCLHLTLQQLSGPLIVVSYAAELIGDSGTRILNSYFIAVVLAAFLLIGGLVCTAMNHRESAITLSSVGIVVSGLLIASYNLVRRLLLNRLGSQLLSFIPLLGLIIFVMSCAVGLVPNLPVSNTPGEHVALAISFVVAFIVIKSYLYVQAYLGWWTFAFFAVAAGLNIIVGVLMFSQPKSNRTVEAKQQDSAAGPAV